MIIDAHLDLAYNALNFDRDLTLPLAVLRAQEPVRGRPDNGRATVTLPALIEGGVGLVWATLFAPPVNSIAARDGRRLAYRDAAEAHQLAMNQLDYYRRLADEQPDVTLVGDRDDLAALRAAHDGLVGPVEARPSDPPRLGLLPLMEGADPVQAPEEVAFWFERGVRAIGPAWGDTTYAPGAWGAGGRLPPAGHELLAVMGDLGMILDLTHMAEAAFLDALDAYEGVVVATHSNARALVPGDRQLSDTQIRRLAERDGVIGIVPLNRFLRRGHAKGGPKARVPLSYVVAHIDHICQLLGTAAHCGIGSDFDGGFGSADIPAEMDSIVDLAKIGTALQERGYEAAAIDAIMGENWYRVLARALPANA